MSTINPQALTPRGSYMWHRMGGLPMWSLTALGSRVWQWLLFESLLPVSLLAKRHTPLWSVGRKNNYSSLGRLQKQISHRSLKELLPLIFPNGSRGTWHALPVPLLSTSSFQFLAECHFLPGSLWCSWQWHRSLHPEHITLIGTLNSCVTEPYLMCFCCPRA